MKIGRLEIKFDSPFAYGGSGGIHIKRQRQKEAYVQLACGHSWADKAVCGGCTDDEGCMICCAGTTCICGTEFPADYKPHSRAAL